MALVYNKRYVRSQQLLAQVLHIVEPYLRESSKEGSPVRDVARELGELFHCSGVQIITEGDRAAAGLPPRDHYGMTLDEIRIIEHKLLLASMAPAPLLFVDIDGKINVERTMAEAAGCPKCRAADQAKAQLRNPHDVVPDPVKAARESAAKEQAKFKVPPKSGDWGV